MTAPTPAGWYPDPAASSSSTGPAQLRWWDGSQWTDHLRAAEPAVAAHSTATGAGQQTSTHIPGSEYGGRTGFGTAPQPPAEPQQQYGAQQQQYGAQQHQPQQQSWQQGPTGQVRSPYTENAMAVSQKRKIIELTNEYDIYGADGQVIGRVVEVGQSGLKKAARFLSSLDQFMTHRLEVRDSAAQVIFTLTRPAKIMKSTLVVTHPNGAEMGRLVQQNVFGKIRFSLEAGGQQVGLLSAENWIAWNFKLQDHAGAEVGRITKTFEGILTTMFTTADTYSVHLSPHLTEPLKSLCIAAALCVDTALKQDSRGFG
ncbi:phospholipid scramblase-related protein [Nakamurella sp. A5-74]|uniref:Phospholipid scramblase-related protein n=1 Tax=Nakamurella sp. A5-74 TaxID=3158264 RepID=A0AAU8DUQ0_9ACTN